MVQKVFLHMKSLFLKTKTRIFSPILDRIERDQVPPVFVLAIIYLLAIAGLTNQMGQFFALCIPLVLYYQLPSLIGTTEIQLEVECERSIYRAVEGESISITWVIKNRGDYLREVKIATLFPQGLTKPDGHSSMITTLESQESLRFCYTIEGIVGKYSVPDLEIKVPDLLRLRKEKKIFSSHSQVLILPQFKSNNRIVLRPHRVRPQTGVNLSRQGGDGIEAFGIREYRPGDPLKYVNARASAKHPKTLFIQEFEREKATTVFVLVDSTGLNHTQKKSQNTLNHLLKASALLSESLLNAGNRVGMYLYGNYYDWVFPGSGKLQKEKLFRVLALKAESEVTWGSKLDSLPTRFLTPRSIIILISPLLGAEPWMLYTLRGRRYQILVISPDEISPILESGTETSLENLGLRTAKIERDLLIRKLGKNSIPVLNWPVNLPFETMASKFLGVHWK